MILTVEAYQLSDETLVKAYRNHTVFLKGVCVCLI